MTQMLIHMNFAHDLEELLRGLVAHRGHKESSALEAWKLFALLQDNDKRNVPEQPYSVRISDELTEKAERLPVASVLQEVIARFETGMAIEPYLSKQTQRLSHLDGLLLNWGINHLHLSSISTLKRGFVGRSDFLLFFHQQGTSVYLIDVLPHPKKDDPVGWSQSQLVRIADRNWPELHQLLEGQSLTQTITDEHYAALRAKNINTVIGTDRGVVVPKLGVTGAGHSLDSLREFDQMCDRLDNLQTLIRQRYHEMFPMAKSYVTSLVLLRIEEDSFVVWDACTDQVMEVPNRYVL
ncbi:hypothetical protein [Comamonas terrigena]|uniref:hypothetical protein n=1 Tax=Comamonas terrigena TaxID=32013 RepID=UPI0028AF1C78|nr:hypothetical protein [Comamonas terrigena]